MFKRYESLPKQVQAVEFTEKNKDMIFNSLTGQHSAAFEGDKPILKVKTVHGEIAIVRIGDWIVKDKEIGTYYPIKPDIWKNSYTKTHRKLVQFKDY